MFELTCGQKSHLNKKKYCLVGVFRSLNMISEIIINLHLFAFLNAWNHVLDIGQNKCHLKKTNKLNSKSKFTWRQEK
jgi:hypothetical protein